MNLARRYSIRLMIRQQLVNEQRIRFQERYVLGDKTLYPWQREMLDHFLNHEDPAIIDAQQIHRQAGKTTVALKLAELTNGIMVVPSVNMARYIRQYNPETNVEILSSRQTDRLRGRRPNTVIIDEVDSEPLRRIGIQNIMGFERRTA